ncbi:MAG: O-antigen ligase family protein, partial [Fibromonadaceae bacterium]|nr:O-antigen ligase family protein [Fibromonadaceae bacterium]
TTLIAIYIRKRNEIPIEALPYLAMPAILFASINEKLEFATNDMIMCVSMGIATLIVFTQKEMNNKWLYRSMIICTNIHLVIQVFGMIIGSEKIAISTTFPMANEIMFFYMLAMFCSILIYHKDNNLLWKKYAKIIGILAFISLIAGEAIHTKKLEIGGEHALGIWLGLGCGALFTITLFLWKKNNLPKKLGISFAALIFLILMSISIIVVNSSFFSSSSPSEVASRVDNWKAAWSIISEKPFGIGFGSYGANAMQHWPALEECHRNLGAMVFNSVHNQYLQILTEIGWLGWLYYCALFAIPWFISISRYLKTGKLQFLFIAGILASVLSVMNVSEAISLFAFIQIIHWLLLIYSVKALLPLQTQRHIKVSNLARNLFFIILIPLIAFLLYDRSKQLYSMYLSRKYGKDIPLGRVLEIYPKNSEALGFAWTFYFENENYEEALKTTDAIEEIAGHLWPVSQARAVTYLAMGDSAKACEAAKFPISRCFYDIWTQSLRERLVCESS